MKVFLMYCPGEVAYVGNTYNLTGGDLVGVSHINKCLEIVYTNPNDSTLHGWPEDHKLKLYHLSQLSKENVLDIVKIASGKNYIEPHQIGAAYTDTVKERMNIFNIEFLAYVPIKHQGDKPKHVRLHITTWGTINIYVDGELATNAHDAFIWQYLINNQFAIPLFFDVDHPANGMTAIDLELAQQKED